ncbi:MAG TPA: EAL domain-containing protein [Rhodospirillales bacterium]|nr:EAL domain-containing protein [Rhodospirillales bacterium]
MPTPPSVRSDSSTALLRGERNRFVAFAFTWPDLLFELDDAGRIVYATGALDSMIGRTAAQVVGSAFTQLVVPGQRAAAGWLIAAATRRERLDGATIALLGPAGVSVPLAFAGHCLPELHGHVFVGLRQEGGAGGGTGSALPAGDANRDAGSGLLESRAFVDGVCRQLRDFAAADETPQQLSLIRLVGVDRLHEDMPASDPLLRTLGGTLRARSLNGDLALRVGANRFGLLHGPNTDVEKLKQEILDLLPAEARRTPGVGIEAASIAIVVDELRSEEVAKAIVAIINRFRTIEGPGTGLSSLSTPFPVLAREAIGNIDGLKRIIADNGFNIVFQPIIHALHGHIHHYEALVRFPPTGNLESTFECVSLAEELGLVEALDIGVARKVVHWLHGAKASIGATCAVNVSGQSVTSPTHTERLLELLDDNPGIHSRLLFEITESSRIRNLSAANEFVHRLRDRGCAVCLDDFGAGAANFPYIAALDVDIVKFDGPAVQGARRSAKGTTFLKALLDVCRQLGITTVFEMVDDEAGLEFARDCGADYVQGYLFGKPSARIEQFRRTIPARLFQTLQAL